MLLRISPLLSAFRGGVAVKLPADRLTGILDQGVICPSVTDGAESIDNPLFPPLTLWDAGSALRNRSPRRLSEFRSPTNFGGQHSPLRRENFGEYSASGLGMKASAVSSFLTQTQLCLTKGQPIKQFHWPAPAPEIDQIHNLESAFHEPQCIDIATLGCCVHLIAQKIWGLIT